MPATIQLTLTPEQAATLLLLHRLTGGHPERTLRGYMDQIRDQLLFQGISAPLGLAPKLLEGPNITFQDGSKQDPAFLDLVATIEALEPRMSG